jgi:predicted aspartyl protease
MAQTLQQSGQPVPAPISGWALIDTGSDGTCIDGARAAEMGLPVIDIAKMSSASHQETEQNVHPIKIEFAGVPIIVEAERAMTAKLDNFGLLLIIGRDTLQHCTFMYNGVAGCITLSA